MAVPIILIEDPRDERLGDYLNVSDPELVERGGIFVAEGRLVVKRLLESGWTTRSVMVTETALASVQDVLEKRPALPVYLVAQPVMNSIGGINVHRGCMALGVRRPARS